MIRDSVLKREPLLECSDFAFRFTVEDLELECTPRGYINRLDIDKTGNGGASMVVLRGCELLPVRIPTSEDVEVRSITLAAMG